MKSSLFQYFIVGLFNLLTLSISLEFTITSVIEIDYLGVILWSLIFSLTLNEFVDKQREFEKYYPHFEDRWNQPL
jgi:hypothetical protein